MRRTKPRYAALAALLVLALLQPGATLAQTSPDVAVVVHADVPVDNLTLAELRRIVLGDREFWPGGVRLTLLMRAPVAHERDIVLQTVSKMSEAQFRQHWIAKVFRADTAAAPRIVYSSEMALDLVRQIPGAVTFVSSGAANPGVKVVRIDGKRPGEPGYPLR
jgi:ABC-type phosphate transport system substrate-binding protein